MDTYWPWRRRRRKQTRNLGHDEHAESVANKTQHALSVGLNVILCVGETLQDRETGKTLGCLQPAGCEQDQDRRLGAHRHCMSLCGPLVRVLLHPRNRLKRCTLRYASGSWHSSIQTPPNRCA